MIERNRLRILILSAYDAISHCRWREQLTEMLPHYELHALTLPPRFFAWRIRGNALSWLQEPRLEEPWDLLLATSTVDLAALRGLHPDLARTPALLYMHENQFAYPESARQPASAEPAMVNLYSALAADRVVFNSRWNRDSFLAGARVFLSRMPDAVPSGLIEMLQEKAVVIAVPVEDRLYRERAKPPDRECPHLLWNHRWEYDKGPDRLLRLLDRLVERSQPFRLSVVGEQFRQRPEAFDEIYRRHEARLVHWGYIEDRQQYEGLLGEADVVVSTALHDFQGLAMQEAMASGCIPLAPDRLAYPEYVPPHCRYPSHESDPDAEADAAARCLDAVLASPAGCEPPEAWRVSRLQVVYDDVIRAALR